MNKLSLASALALSLAASSAIASPHMRITKCDGAETWKDCAIISLNGYITFEDGQEFISRTEEIKTARVDLDSLGGSTFGGFLIGEAIHGKGFTTNVNDNTKCYSSCAHIWTAGRTKTLGHNSSVGFHSPLTSTDSEHADGMTSAMLGMYLSKLGYTYKDIMNTIGHDPSIVHIIYNDVTGTVREKDVHLPNQELK